MVCVFKTFSSPSVSCPSLPYNNAPPNERKGAPALVPALRKDCLLMLADSFVSAQTAASKQYVFEREMNFNELRLFWAAAEASDQSNFDHAECWKVAVAEYPLLLQHYEKDQIGVSENVEGIARSEWDESKVVGDQDRRNSQKLARRNSQKLAISDLAGLFGCDENQVCQRISIDWVNKEPSCRSAAKEEDAQENDRNMNQRVAVQTLGQEEQDLVCASLSSASQQSRVDGRSIRTDGRNIEGLFPCRNKAGSPAGRSEGLIEDTAHIGSPFPMKEVPTVGSSTMQDRKAWQALPSVVIGSRASFLDNDADFSDQILSVPHDTATEAKESAARSTSCMPAAENNSPSRSKHTELGAAKTAEDAATAAEAAALEAKQDKIHLDTGARDLSEEVMRREEEQRLRIKVKEQERQQREDEEKLRREAEEQEQQRLEEAFPAMSKFVFSQPFKEVVHALSVHGAATEGDLKYVEDQSLDQLFTSQHEPLEQGDKTTIRELRLRLVQEEEERIRRAEEVRVRLEEEVRVKRDRAELLKGKAGAAAQKKAEGDAARQAAAEEPKDLDSACAHSNTQAGDDVATFSTRSISKTAFEIDLVLKPKQPSIGSGVSPLLRPALVRPPPPTEWKSEADAKTGNPAHVESSGDVSLWNMLMLPRTPQSLMFPASPGTKATAESSNPFTRFQLPKFPDLPPLQIGGNVNLQVKIPEVRVPALPVPNLELPSIESFTPSKGELTFGDTPQKRKRREEVMAAMEEAKTDLGKLIASSLNSPGFFKQDGYPQSRLDGLDEVNAISDRSRSLADLPERIDEGQEKQFLMDRLKQMAQECKVHEQEKKQEDERQQEREFSGLIQAARQREEQGVEVKLKSYDLMMTSRNPHCKNHNRLLHVLMHELGSNADAVRACDQQMLPPLPPLPPLQIGGKVNLQVKIPEVRVPALPVPNLELPSIESFTPLKGELTFGDTPQKCKRREEVMAAMEEAKTDLEKLMGQASSAFVNILSFRASPPSTSSEPEERLTASQQRSRAWKRHQREMAFPQNGVSTAWRFRRASADACRTGGEGGEGEGGEGAEGEEGEEGRGSDELLPEHHDDATSVEGGKDLRVPASASTPSMQCSTPGSARREKLLQAEDAVDILEEGHDTSDRKLTLGDTPQKSNGREEGIMAAIEEAVVEAKDLRVPVSAAASSMQGGTPGSARRKRIELKQAEDAIDCREAGHEDAASPFITYLIRDWKVPPSGFARGTLLRCQEKGDTGWFDPDSIATQAEPWRLQEAEESDKLQELPACIQELTARSNYSTHCPELTARSTFSTHWVDDAAPGQHIDETSATQQASCAVAHVCPSAQMEEELHREMERRGLSTLVDAFFQYGIQQLEEMIVLLRSLTQQDFEEGSDFRGDLAVPLTRFHIRILRSWWQEITLWDGRPSHSL